MSTESESHHAKRCPRTASPIRPRPSPNTRVWLLPIVGLIASVWFLVRCIPKPSRITYPCQQAAAPLALGFFLWLTGIAVAGLAFFRARAHFLGARFTLATAQVK